MQTEQNKELDSLLNQIPNEQLRAVLKQKMEEVINYVPTIGIMGKSGMGKSSLINAIVGKQVCKTSDGTERGTEGLSQIDVPVGKRTIRFIDFPGIADADPEKTKAFEEIYKEQAPKLDVILWVNIAKLRDLEKDVEFYQWLKQYYQGEFLFVLTHSDIVHPSNKWDHSQNKPSEKQEVQIDIIRNEYVKKFKIEKGNVIAISAMYYEDEARYGSYNMDQLIGAIIHKVPNKAKSGIYSAVAEQNKTEEAKIEAQSGFEIMVNEIADTAIEKYVPEPLQEPVKKIKAVVIKGAKALWNKLFG